MRTIEFEQVARALWQAQCFDFQNTTLSNGQNSKVYCDLGNLESFPEQRELIVRIYEKLADGLLYSCLADVPTRSTFLVSIMSYKLNIGQITPHLKIKDHGRRSPITGVYKPKDIALIIDDLVNSGGSFIRHIQVLRESGLVVNDALALIDRQQGGKDALKKHGVTLHTYQPIGEFLEYYSSHQYITGKIYQESLRSLGLL